MKSSNTIDCSMRADEPIALKIARIAHESWCCRMASHGWRLGYPTDKRAKVHDALVQFDSLSPRDKRSAMICTEAEEFESRLADAIEYERGPAREFLLEDMRDGLRVGWNRDAFDEVDGIDLDDLGFIIDWKVGDGGIELESIEVRWDGGGTTNHHPCERDLRRVETIGS